MGQNCPCLGIGKEGFNMGQASMEAMVNAGGVRGDFFKGKTERSHKSF